MAFALSVLLLLFSGCSATQKTPTFSEQLEREASAGDESTLESPDGTFSTRIAGELARPMEVASDGSGVTGLIDFGASTPAECLFLAEDLDLAAALLDLSNASFEEVSQQLGPIVAKQVRDVRAFAVGSAPALSVEWLYTVGHATGHLKHRIASVRDRAVYCRHLQTGYRESFASLFEGIVKSVRYRSRAKPTPYYTTVSQMKLSGAPVGVEKMIMTREGVDAVRIERRSSLLVAVDGGTLMSNDVMDVFFAQPNGELINGVHVQSENGELVSHLSLDPDERGWKVSGTLQEKPYAATIDHGAAVATPLGEALAVRDAIRDEGTGATLDLREWLPEANPSAATVVHVRVGERHGDGNYDVDYSMGGLRMRAVVTPAGDTSSGVAHLGNVEIEMQQVYQEGNLGGF